MNQPKPDNWPPGELAELDQQLRQAMPADPPDDLAERIFQATVDDLPGRSTSRKPRSSRSRQDRTSGVLRKIGPLIRLGLAAAAVLLIGVTLNLIWQQIHSTNTSVTGPTVALNNSSAPGSETGTLAEVDDEQLEQVSEAVASADSLDDNLKSLQQDMSELAMVFESDNLDVAGLSDELSQLEQQLRSF